MAATQRLSLVAIAVCCLAGLVVSVDNEEAIPLRDTDVVFVVQRKQDYSAGSANMKEFMKEFAAYYDEHIPDIDKVTVRFAVVHYDGEAQVACDFDTGLYLNKISQLNSAIDELPLDMVESGADLGGALTLAGNILAQQSYVYQNRFVIVITDGDMTGDQQTFQDAIHRVHENYTNVFVMKIAGEDNPTFQANIDAIIEGNSQFMEEVDFLVNNNGLTTRDLQIRDILIIRYRNIIIIIVARSIDKITVTLEMGACSKTCGVGLRFRRLEVEVFINGNLVITITITVHEYCCIMRCSEFGFWFGGVPLRYCRSYPPINGQP